MKIFISKKIKQIDEYTIQKEPIASIDLMERAAGKCFDWLKENIEATTTLHFFIGPGNNGGDGLAIARMMAENGYENVLVYMVKISDTLSPDATENLSRLKKVKKLQVNEIQSVDDFPVLQKEDLVIDALFGSGLSRPLEGVASEVVKYINRARSSVVAIDIPSGLFSEDNSGNDVESIIKANVTLTFQFPKVSFLFAKNYPFTGEWVVLDIGLHEQFMRDLSSKYFLLTPAFFKDILKTRDKFSHKGTFGHALLVSGSYGKMGAAVLATEACLRTGAGLVTTRVPRYGNDILQTTLPEAMLSLDKKKKYITDVPEQEKYTAIGVGPGIGTKSDTKDALEKLFRESHRPLVIDADALNIIGDNKELLELVPPESILTPHPKEFRRLVGKNYHGYQRLKAQLALANDINCYVIVKGAYTTVACPDGFTYFNTSGNPGMATAGSGDVLTGMITALLAQDYTPRNAAMLGVFLHGLAGDLASDFEAQESMVASDIINNIGMAYNMLKDKIEL